MKHDLHFLMNSFHQLTGIWIQYYESDELIYRLPETTAAKDDSAAARAFLDHQTYYVSYHITADFHYYGKVQLLHHEGLFVIGTKQAASTRISYEQFLNALSLLNYMVNQTRISVDALIQLNEQQNNEAASLHNELTTTIFEAKEQALLHNTYALEQQIASYVRMGDVKQLTAMFEQAALVSGGPVAKDTLRQARNIFIITTTIMTRAAIEGGLHIETAFHLSDIYIQKVEHITRLDAITSLQLQMLMELTELVARNRYPEGASPDIIQAMQFIQQNTNRTLSITEIARTVGLSPAYLSSKFKQETGMSMSYYMNVTKIEEAKNLLLYSDKTLSEISHYLSFSSQSYFHNLFKKMVGQTPQHYRKQARKSDVES